MPNTPNLDLPYPDDEDWLNQGAYTIEQLATAVDDLYPDHLANINPAQSPAAVGGATVVDFPGLATLRGFTYAGGVLTYTGPTRPFLIATTVEIEHGGTNLTTMQSTVTVRTSGVDVMGSIDQVDSIASSTGTLQLRRRAHTISVPGILATGDTVDVVATASPAGALGVTSIRVYPIGPAT